MKKYIINIALVAATFFMITNGWAKDVYKNNKATGLGFSEDDYGFISGKPFTSNSTNQPKKDETATQEGSVISNSWTVPEYNYNKDTGFGFSEGDYIHILGKPFIGSSSNRAKKAEMVTQKDSLVSNRSDVPGYNHNKDTGFGFSERDYVHIVGWPFTGSSSIRAKKAATSVQEGVNSGQR